MKLILKQYLASLKERSELDVVLPDLLSEMGMNVFISPTRGVKEYGVDVAAVGSIRGDAEKVYLFSVKSGNLTRSTWRGNTDQALRPSLEEIQDSFIPARIPPEHADKPIVICLCFGGDVHSGIRQDVSGYLRRNTEDNISFEEWNGDKLSDLILEYLLKEELLPKNWQSMLRKSLALLDEPEASHHNFRLLVHSIIESTEDTKGVFNAILRVHICLWILYSWCRDEGNLESAYLSAEYSILHLWDKAKTCQDRKSKTAFKGLLSTYHLISDEYVNIVIGPVAEHLHAASTAVSSPSGIDINLKLFDVMGRVALRGLWMSEELRELNIEDNELKDAEYHSIQENKLDELTVTMKKLIKNNPVLHSPFKDSQAIDLGLALYLFSLDSRNDEFVVSWLEAIVNRVEFAFITNSMYPTTLEKFQELLMHKNTKDKDDSYKEKVTRGSILFPLLATYCSLYRATKLSSVIKEIVDEHLPSCTLQYWYPNKTSEEHMYANSKSHGLATTGFPLTPEEVLTHIGKECKESNQYWELSAVKEGHPHIVLSACRYYRYPVPFNLLEDWIIQYSEN